MDDIAYSQAIIRLRRAQPNNAALLEVLDEAQARLTVQRFIEPPPKRIPTDRKAYMRELMRKRRAAAKLDVT